MAKDSRLKKIGVSGFNKPKRLVIKQIRKELNLLKLGMVKILLKAK